MMGSVNIQQERQCFGKKPEDPKCSLYILAWKLLLVLHWMPQPCRGHLTVCVCPSCIHTREEDRGEAATLSTAEQVASSLRLAVTPSTSSVVSTSKLFLFHIQYCALYNIIVPRTDCQRGSDKSGWLGKLCQEGKNSQMRNAHSELLSIPAGYQLIPAKRCLFFQKHLHVNWNFQRISMVLR